LFPTKISIKSGLRTVFVTSAPIPLKNSIGSGKEKLFRVFECGPSAPISKLQFAEVVK